MGRPNYIQLDLNKIALGANVQHSPDSGSNLFFNGIPPMDHPEVNTITIIYNGVRPEKEKLTEFQELDNLIFAANKKYILNFLEGNKLKVDYWQESGYRIHLWDSIKAKSNPINVLIPTKYELKNNTIAAFKFKEKVIYKGVQYIYIKFVYSNDNLIYALQCEDKSIIIVNSEDIETKPTTNYSIKFPTHFYSKIHYNTVIGEDFWGKKIAEEVELFKINTNVIHSGYNNQIYYIAETRRFRNLNHFPDTTNFSEKTLVSLLNITEPIEFYEDIVNTKNKELKKLKLAIKKLILNLESNKNLMLNSLECKSTQLSEYESIIQKYNNEKIAVLTQKIFILKLDKKLAQTHIDAITLHNT